MKFLHFIRKFGLEHCDLPTMMWNLSFLLRALTLDIDGKGVPVVFYFLVLLCIGCFVYVYVVSVVWFVFWRCMETGDILAAVLVFSLGMASEIGPVKFINAIIYKQRIRKVATTCLACDALVTPGTRFSRNLQGTLRSVKLRAIVFWVIMMGNGVVYLARPFLLPGRHLMEDNFIYYGLEPMLETPNYEISLISTMFGVSFACYSVANVTAFLILSTGYVEAQMLAWSEELTYLWDDFESYANEFSALQHGGGVYLNNKLVNEYVQSRLKDVIRGHARNLDVIKQIEYVFRGVFAIELLILILGLISELLGGLENTYIEVPYSFIPVVVDCFTGQRLADASLAFERAIYECKWENFDRTSMRLVLLMLQSSQKPMNLSAGGLKVLNFSLLMSIIRSIYSAYTTLRSYTL